MSELARSVISALSEHGQTVAVAESLTGGLVCATLVDIAGSSVAVRGAIVAYATELKHRLLGVDEALLGRNGPVDQDVATQMALGVRARLAADWGIATTGVAGPGPQDGVPAGTVYVAVASADVTLIRRLDISGDRNAVRLVATEGVLSLLLGALVGGPGTRPSPSPGGPEHDRDAHR
jgi:nicotinamide-nucleotide amidase